MFNVIIVLILIISVLLILVVLAQNSKGGIGAQFGGSGAAQMMGVKKTSDLLEQLTWGFSIALMVLCLAASVVLKPDEIQQQEELSSPNIERAQEKTVIPSGSIPTAEDESSNNNQIIQEESELEGLEEYIEDEE